jgi:hypothetical protein
VVREWLLSVVETRSCEWDSTVQVVDWPKSPGVAGQEEVVCGLDPDPGDSVGTLVSIDDVVSVQVVASVLVLALVIP